VTEAGGDATMGMLGETVFALGTGLTDAGYDPTVCQVDPTGATLVTE
jgi:pantoate kinase